MRDGSALRLALLAVRLALHLVWSVLVDGGTLFLGMVCWALRLTLMKTNDAMAVCVALSLHEL